MSTCYVLTNNKIELMTQSITSYNTENLCVYTTNFNGRHICKLCVYYCISIEKIFINKYAFTILILDLYTFKQFYKYISQLIKPIQHNSACLGLIWHNPAYLSNINTTNHQLRKKCPQRDCLESNMRSWKTDVKQTRESQKEIDHRMFAGGC